MLARISLGVAAMMLGIVALAAYVGNGSDQDQLYPVATGESGSTGLARFYQQRLAWTACGGSLCTWVKVPLDYNRPLGETIRLRVRLRPAEDGRAKGRVFVNPGGPGGSGVDFVDTFVSLASKDLLKAHDVIGFDPRGVARSAPLECLSAGAFDKIVETDPTPDDPKEVDDLHDAFRSVGAACVKNSATVASHVSTEEAARDLDVLRVLMGEDNLDYYGASYGTQLGATYASLFPDKTGAMVLDGAVNPSLTSVRQAEDKARSFDTAFRSFLKQCVEQTSCPLGETVDEAEDSVVALVDQLDDKPLKTRTDRELTEGSALYGMAYAMYDPDSWSVLQTGLVRASFGDGTILLRLGDQYYGREADGTYEDNGAQAGFAVRCLDFPRSLSTADLQSRLAKVRKESPVFGAMMAWTATECQDWPAKSKYAQKSVDTEDAASPIVVIGTTRDPATPFPWAKALSKQLSSSVLVTRKGDGHTGFGVGNTCVDRVVDRYLAFDEPPTDPVTCDEGA